MKVIYHDYGGSHSSVVAAALHLGVLPMDRKPTGKEIMEKVPHFDGLNPKDHGRIKYRGTDQNGNQVFTLGSAIARKIAMHAIYDATEMWGIDKTQLYFVNTMPCVNIWMMIGGFLSRALGWVAIGRPIVTMGTIKAYYSLVDLVQTETSRIANVHKLAYLKEKRG